MKERYANIIVDSMHQHEKMVKKHYFPEEVYIEYCDDNKVTTNNINDLISSIMNEGQQQQFRIFAVDEDGIITESNIEDANEDTFNNIPARAEHYPPIQIEEQVEHEEVEHEEEEQAPEPIYDVNPNATDVEICASFTSLLSYVNSYDNGVKIIYKIFIFNLIIEFLKKLKCFFGQKH